MQLIFKYILTFALFFASFGFSFSQSTLDIDKLDDAVVVVVIYDYYGNYLGHGSGFFISSTGTVVTNYHVIEEACSAEINTEINGVKKTFSVDKVISGDKELDLVKLSIKNPSNFVFPYLTLATNYPKKGDACWVIGSPADIAFMNTVSDGIISNLHLNMSPKFLQTNADIAHGSSGGPLISKTGIVLGVASGALGTEDGNLANINLAIWIGELNNIITINKTLPLNPDLIPCQVSFYTTNPYTKNVYLYVDGLYIGKFSQYFSSGQSPNCGDAGTITKFISSGKHNYTVKYADYGTQTSGSFILSPGQCIVLKVVGVTSSGQNVNNNGPTYTPVDSHPSSSMEFNKIDNDYRFLFSAGAYYNEYFEKFSPYKIPPLLTLDTYFKNSSFSPRLKVCFYYRKPNYTNQPIYYDPNHHNLAYSFYYLSYGLDFKFINTPNRSNRHLFIAPFFYYSNLIIDYSRPFFANYTLYQTFYYENIETYNNLNIGIRVGGEKLWSKHFAVTTECGIGYLTSENRIFLDFTVLVGLRLINNN